MYETIPNRKRFAHDFFYFSYNYLYLNSNEKIHPLTFLKEEHNFTLSKGYNYIGRLLHIIKWYVRITFLK